MVENPYLTQVIQNLPRLLSLFDTDNTSKSYGMGDRYYWAWGLIDFGNGTFQGAAHGLARLWKYGLWPYSTEKKEFIRRIDSIFIGAKTLTRKDGSLEEAFPKEGSYCVTALVAFDLLCTIELLEADIELTTKVNWISIANPMIEYLIRSDETHALISNHLATAIAALVRWHSITGEQKAEFKAKALLDRVLKHQSTEGWFKEYQGADPGYQSLCTYYLADVHINRPDFNLLEPLKKSIQFLWYFAHPDGSFGGHYGSRCTRFYYPAGIELLATVIPEAAALADFMCQSISNNTVVTLSSMDEPNLIPMFNEYCTAAVIRCEYPCYTLKPELPNQTMEGRIIFKKAGLIVDRGKRHYTIINFNKGGIVMHFKDKKLVLNNSGVVITNSSGKLGSTQSFAPENNNLDLKKENVIAIRSEFTPMPKQLPTPFDFLLLRLFSVTVFHVSFIRELIKMILVFLLITRKKTLSGYNIREIILGEDLTLSDKLKSPKGYKLLKNPGSFISIHMASQGYWQIQQEENL